MVKTLCPGIGCDDLLCKSRISLRSGHDNLSRLTRHTANQITVFTKTLFTINLQQSVHYTFEPVQPKN
jgi:hypothetical protein